MRSATHEVVKYADAKQAHWCNCEAHDRTAKESHIQRSSCTFRIGRNGCSDIRLCCWIHAYIAGNTRAKSTKREGNGCVDTKAPIKGSDTDQTENGQTFIFAGHEDHRAKMNLIRNFFDPALSGRGL